MRFKDVPDMRESKIKRFLRMPEFEEHLALHRLDCLSSHGSLPPTTISPEKNSRKSRPNNCAPCRS